MIKKPFVPGRDVHFKAEYFADVFQYNNNTKENRTDHTVKAFADIYFSNKLFIKMKEKFKKTADPPNSEIINLEKRVRNINEVILGYKGRLFNIEIGSQYVRDNYENLNSLDKKEYITMQTIYLNISPKTALFVELDSGKMRYDNTISNIDSEYIQWRGGIKGTLAPKLTGVIKGGCKVTDYEDIRTISERNYKKGVA